ncbi:MAG: hypothetical protein A3H42_04160 [Deltaproteobacteria bacterium RIFCSPLOWO2_02_FULL_46_8]|nr:MAG: hypothetical protein A3H42_04160 [Deltaproteobacteria bacterium RIFCSPLOWO2_02_FULL_46_8]
MCDKLAMFSAYTHFLYRARWPLAVFFTVIFGLCIWKSSHLKLRSDFKELLPENFQSVKDLERIGARVGSTGSLIVAIESDSSQDSIRFAKDLISKLNEYPPEYIQSIEYNVSESKKFFEDNKYLYIDLPDLQEIHDRLARRIQREKLKTTGLLLELETPEERDAAFTTKDIEEKYKSKTAKYDDYIDGYFFGEKGRLMVVIIRPPGSATGVEFSKKLVIKVNETITQLNPKNYNSSMIVGFTGKFRRVLFEYQTLIDDIVSTALLCITLVSLAVLLYFHRFRMVFLMGWSVFNGIAWTFAATTWKIGYLTTQTAFLGSIIIGNGINYSLILMARYLEERKQHKTPLEALQISIPSTLAGTLTSSLTTCVAFGTLIITNIRGFTQFGFIGALGMFSCWVASYTVLPAFLAISEEIVPLIRPTTKAWFHFHLLKKYTSHLSSWAKNLNRATIALSLVSVVTLLFFIPNSLEYDFTKLRVKSKGREASEEAKLNDRVRPIFGASMTPAVLVTDRTDQVIPLCDVILQKNTQDPVEKQVVDSCKSIYSHIPADQDEKMRVLKKIRKLLDDSSLDFLNEEQKKEVEKFRTETIVKPVALKDLPENVLKNYREKNGDLGKLVYVYPTDKAPLWNGKNLMRFANMIRENKLPTGEVLTASGDSVIFSDILIAVMKDGPKATLIAFLAVCLVVALIFREWRGFVFITGTLVLGVLWMGGAIGLLNIKINFFNFIAIPTTFGIGVDYGVNIYQRYKLEGKGSLPKVLNTTGGAVTLCSITTIIGYFTLIIAKSQALVSFGWIGIIGEVTCLAAAMVFVPTLVMRLEQKNRI